MRLFGEPSPRVILYRDAWIWCPFSQAVWLQLEEKKIPYAVDFSLGLSVYGDIPDWYAKVRPSGEGGGEGLLEERGRFEGGGGVGY
jgi:glutathione S-transferase